MKDHHEYPQKFLTGQSCWDKREEAPKRVRGTWLTQEGEATASNSNFRKARWRVSLALNKWREREGDVIASKRKSEGGHTLEDPQRQRLQQTEHGTPATLGRRL